MTLAATPGQTVVVPGFTVTGSNTQNLTIEGFAITAPGNTGNPQDGNPNNGIQLLCGISGLNLEYNTIEGQPKGDAIFAFAGNCGSGHTQDDVEIEYNQIDHVENGLQVDGGDTEEENFTFAHNVIGPDIQYEGSGHYIQFQGVAGLAVDNNVFEGPPDASEEICNPSGANSHLNVMHVDNGETSVTFAGNILWHTQACGQEVLIQNTPLDNIAITNNLDVEDPGCATMTPYPCDSTFALVEAPHGFTFEHNTIVGALRGTTLGDTNGESYSNPNAMTAEYNIAEGTPESGQHDYDSWSCSSSCTTADNTSQDTTATSVFGGSGNVTGWTPSWTTTTWTPVSGPGYQPPPTGYYQPTGLSISGAGYQGQIGP